MKKLNFFYRTIEICLDQEGNVLKKKVKDFNTDPYLSKAQAETYALKKLKQAERNPVSFHHEFDLTKDPSNLELDVQLFLVLVDKGIEEELCLLSQHSSNAKNLKKEKWLQKEFLKRRSKAKIIHYLNLFESAENRGDVKNEPFPVPCYFKALKLKKNGAGEIDIVEDKEFRPKDYGNYVKMQKAAKEYHFSCISNDSDPMEQMKHIFNGTVQELSEFNELYIVLVEEKNEKELLRLRNYQINLEGFNIDNYLEVQCLQDITAFLKAKLKYHKKNWRNQSKNKWKWTWKT